MITALGAVPGTVQVFGDARNSAYGTYTSDAIDLQGINKVPVVQVTNGDGAVKAYLERSSDNIHWGRQKNNPDTMERLAPKEIGFLQDSLPVSVRYMRVVYVLERFPDTSNVSITLI